jgi:outer membrane lipoprotein-sorting protein
MRRTLLFLTGLFALQNAFAQITGEQILEKMHAKFSGKWHRNITYVQTTIPYIEGKATNKQLWYEAIQFPASFRLDVGDTRSGNLVIYSKDSLFKFQENKLISGRKDENDIIFLSGGMYFYPLDEAKKQFRRFQYDLKKGFETEWKGKPVYVLGAANADEKVNQLWVDKEKLVILRIIEYGGQKMEYQFEGHQSTGGGYTETKATIFLEDEKVQVETYSNIETNQVLDNNLFNPKKKDQATHWFQPNVKK